MLEFMCSCISVFFINSRDFRVSGRSLPTKADGETKLVNIRVNSWRKKGSLWDSWGAVWVHFGAVSAHFGLSKYTRKPVKIPVYKQKTNIPCTSGHSVGKNKKNRENPCNPWFLFWSLKTTLVDDYHNLSWWKIIDNAAGQCYLDLLRKLGFWSDIEDWEIE